MSDAGVNTSSEITTKDLKEGSYGGGGEWIKASAIGKANEKIMELEADNEVEDEEEGGKQEEEEEGDSEEVDEMKMRRLRQLQANRQLTMMRMTMLTARS